MLSKLLGIGLVIFGGAIVIFFPYLRLIQAPQMTTTGIIIGLILIGIGLYLLKT